MLHLLGTQVAVFGSGPGLHRLVSTSLVGDCGMTPKSIWSFPKHKLSHAFVVHRMLTWDHEGINLASVHGKLSR
jgi:hypothetical protein